jgi:hypothetical protein
MRKTLAAMCGKPEDAVVAEVAAVAFRGFGDPAFREFGVV